MVVGSNLIASTIRINGLRQAFAGMSNGVSKQCLIDLRGQSSELPASCGLFCIAQRTEGHMPDWLKAWIDSTAPLFVSNTAAMISTLVVGALAGFGLGRLLGTSKSDGLKTQLDARDERINGYKEQIARDQNSIAELQNRISEHRKMLGFDAPGKHRYAAMSNSELKSCAINMASEIQSILGTYKQKASENNFRYDKNAPDEVNKANWRNEGDRVTRAFHEVMQDYDRRFKADAFVLFQTLKDRGARPSATHPLSDHMNAFGRPINTFDLADVIQLLATGAMTLPE
ncbi:hypothetical protein [Burkholderia gladioli]|uniref:hypothetical protein n=1 Tax=Burkholderia gladioli TaxID=28095 RepID=UPI00163E81EF|nr:hypothetical protein [Burkholderia gladioli]